MSTLFRQPVVEDIVSAFKSTQNQSWSMFNNKLGDVLIKDCKKKDIFKSENPIELSDEDIPVFGLVPRLEKLMLVSCNKCSMVVKRDCIHYHYNRRHNNPENDNFSLERFILPIVKINKNKKQKITLRKLPEKKAIDGEDIVVQGIKTEFDQLEFERINEINQVKIKQENELNYVDECDVNLEMGSYNPDTSSNTWLKPNIPNVVNFVDPAANNTIIECDSLIKFVPNIEEELANNICLDIIHNENIKHDTNTNKLLTKPPVSNKIAKPNIVIDFSGILSDEESNELIDNYEDKYFNLLSKLQSNKEQIRCLTNTYLHSVSNNNEKPDENTSQEKTTFTSNENSDIINNAYSDDVLASIDQSVTPVSVEKFIPSNKCLNVLSDEGNCTKVVACQPKVNDSSQIILNETINNKKQPELIPNSSNLDEVSINRSKNPVNCNQFSTALFNIKKEYQSPLPNENELKLSTALLNIKQEYEPPIVSLKEVNTFSQNKYPDNASDEINDGSKSVSHQSPPELLNKREKISTQSCNLPSIKEEINLPNTQYSNTKSNEEIIDQSIGKSNIKLYPTPYENQDNPTPTTFCLGNSYSNIMDTKYSHWSNSNISLSFNVKEETEQTDPCTVVMSNKDSKSAAISCDQSVTLLDVKEEPPSVTTDYLNNAVNVVDNFCFDDSVNSYCHLASEYCENITLLSPLSPSRSTSIDTSSSSEEDMDEIIYSLKNSCNQLPFELLKKEEEETKCSLSSPVNKYSNILYNENSGDAFIGFEHLPTELPSTKDKSKHIFLIDISDDNDKVDHVENDFYQLPESLDNAQTGSSKNLKYLNVGSYKNLPATNNKQSSISSLNVNLKPLFKNTCDGNSRDSTSSCDQSTETKNNFKKLIHKCTQTEILSNQMNHKQCIDPITRVDESVVDSLYFKDNTTKSTQTDGNWPDICMECRQVAIDIVNSFYSVSGIESIKNSINSYIPRTSSTQISKNSLSNSTSVNHGTQTTEYSADSFTPVSSSAQIVNNTITPASFEEFEPTNNNDLDNNVSNNSQYSKRFQQLPWAPNNVNDNFSTRSSVNENNCQLEDNDVIYNSESFTERTKQNENILYNNSISESTLYFDKNHAMAKERLKKIIDEKVVNGKNCNMQNGQLANGNIDTKMKKNLKRRLGGQVTDDKENHIKNNRWITAGFKKFKRVEFVVRKISCSDESDNNDNIEN